MSATIPLQAVRDALMCAVVRRKSSSQIARFAAYSSYPRFFGPSCRDPRRLPAMERLPALHFGPMERGDLVRLLHRHRSEAGLRGVRKTWGAGMRQLET